MTLSICRRRRQPQPTYRLIKSDRGTKAHSVSTLSHFSDIRPANSLHRFKRSRKEHGLPFLIEPDIRMEHLSCNTHNPPHRLGGGETQPLGQRCLNFWGAQKPLYTHENSCTKELLFMWAVCFILTIYIKQNLPSLTIHFFK